MKRYLVIGGVAGGASAAARLRRLDEKAVITVIERGSYPSFSNCALPYYVGGTIASAEQLILMSPEKFKKQHNIDVRVREEALSIDRENHKVQIRRLDTGETYEESYDKLILSPGAKPIVPRSIAGTDRDNVFTVRNVDDIVALKSYLDENHCKRTAVIGGGFIGLEVAENLREYGAEVSVIEAADQIMAPLDYDMTQILNKELLDHGVGVLVGDGLSEIREGKVVLASGREVEADAVVLAIGVAPETRLAEEAGLEIGATRAIKVNQHYQTSDPDIYAVGDAIEVYHRITRKPTRLALAGPAQRQARAAANHIYGIPSANKGVIGTSALRLFDLNVASTGLNEKAAKAAGIPYDYVYIEPFDKPGLMPTAEVLHFKLLFEVPTGRILGAQAIGKGAADKRIDVIAAMITNDCDLEDLKELELAYSPIFSTPKDATNMAAIVGLNVLYGAFRQVHVSEVRGLVESGAYFLDVREEPETANGTIRGAHTIPLTQLRSRMDEIPRDRPVYVHCRSAQRSYYAVRALQGEGFANVVNVSGSYLGICLYEYFNDVTTGREPIVTAYNFN